MRQQPCRSHGIVRPENSSSVVPMASPSVIQRTSAVASSMPEGHFKSGARRSSDPAARAMASRRHRPAAVSIRDLRVAIAIGREERRLPEGSCDPSLAAPVDELSVGETPGPRPGVLAQATGFSLPTDLDAGSSGVRAGNAGAFTIGDDLDPKRVFVLVVGRGRSEEHTSELQSQ